MKGSNVPAYSVTKWNIMSVKIVDKVPIREKSRQGEKEDMKKHKKPPYAVTERNVLIEKGRQGTSPSKQQKAWKET